MDRAGAAPTAAEIASTLLSLVLVVGASYLVRMVDGLETERLGEAGPGGFRESFDSFYRREIRSVVGLAYVLSGSRTAAEDLAQEAFVAAYRQWNRVAAFDDPGAWVRRVVANRSVSAFRRRTSEMRALLRLGSPRVFEVTAFPAESAHVWREVRRLPKRQAQAVVFRHVDGRSIAEIALILRCSENTVKTHLRRAKEKLSDRLEQESGA